MHDIDIMLELMTKAAGGNQISRNRSDWVPNRSKVNEPDEATSRCR